MIATVLLSLSLLAQEGAVAPAGLDAAVDSEHLKALVSSLCTYDTAGRKTGTPGYAVAAGVVVDELERLGLVPGGEDGFRQWVPLVRWSPGFIEGEDGVASDSQTPRLVLTDRAGEEHEFVCGIDFGLPVGQTGTPPMSGSLDVLIVHSLAELPDQADPNAALYLAGGISQEQARDWLATKGQVMADWGLFVRDRSHLSGRRETIPSAFMTLDLGEEDPGDILHARGKSLTLFRAEDVVSVRLVTSWTREDIASENVIGIIPGVGSVDSPGLAEEVIVLTANLDALGRKDNLQRDTYHGADANATGVAALLEIAEALILDPPARTTLFLFATANEQGFLGVKYQLATPTLPLVNTKLALEFFALGAPDPVLPVQNGVWCTSYADSSVGPGLSQADNLVYPDNRPHWHFDSRSATVLYKQAGIIGHRMSSFGGHKRLFTPRDHPQSIDYAHLEEVTRTLLSVVQALCDGSIPIELR